MAAKRGITGSMISPVRSIGITSLMLMLLLAGAARATDLTPAQKQSLPPDVLRAFAKQGLDKTYAFSSQLNPFYIQGDFNGDGHLDTAVLVKAATSSKTGIAVVPAGAGHVVVLGCGTPIPGAQGADNVDWMDAWYAYPKGPVKPGVTKAKPPVLRGDALHVEKTEAASAIIYWDGSKYQWYQQGD